jgi:Domain of unknown function (DUF4157)
MYTRQAPQKTDFTRLSIAPLTKGFEPRPFAALLSVEETAPSSNVSGFGNLLEIPNLFSSHHRSPSVQPKLTLGEPGDQYEQEADRVAAEVVQKMNAPADFLALAQDKDSDKLIQRRLIPPTAQRANQVSLPPIQQQQKFHNCISRRILTDVPDLQADFETRLNHARQGGAPLDKTLRSKVEPIMGADFSGVKVHTDAQADQLSRSIQAKAFTTGQDVFFRQGEYKPGSRGGQELIAHELTHVVQQKRCEIRSEPQLQEHLQQPSANEDSKVVQRVVDVGGETCSVKLWAKVKGLVKKVYGRKKILLEHCSSDIKSKYPGYQDLANALDRENQTKSGVGRIRPSWANGITKFYDRTWGGKRHRRHIIMSSLMRDAVYSVTDKNAKSNELNLLAFYNKIIKAAGFSGYTDSEMSSVEAALVYVLHNNPANLILDSGPENSAIGAIARNVNTYLQKDNIALAKHYAEYQKDRSKFLHSLVCGFVPSIQQNIVKTIDDHILIPTPNIEEFRKFLQIIYDNTAFDLMTKEAMPDYTADMMELHRRFVAVKNNGDMEKLYGIGMTYVSIGVKFNRCPYTSIW